MARIDSMTIFDRYAWTGAASTVGWDKTTRIDVHMSEVLDSLQEALEKVADLEGQNAILLNELEGE